MCCLIVMQFEVDFKDCISLTFHRVINIIKNMVLIHYILLINCAIFVETMYDNMHNKKIKTQRCYTIIETLSSGICVTLVTPIVVNKSEQRYLMVHI